MLLPSLLAVASLIASDQAARQTPPAPTQSQAERQPSGPERPHTFGVGGALAVSTRGGSGGFRYFFNERLGVNFTAGWANGGSNSYGGGSSTYVMPSMIYMITPPNFSREMDIRPYAGGGIHYVHGTNVSTGPGTIPGPRSDWGMQAFGGAELSFKNAKAMTLSIEGIYYQVITSTADTTNYSAFDWTVAFHFYFK